MYVLDVIPFSRFAPAGTLTYRSRTEVEPGTLVTVTLRRKAIQAMVVSCVGVAEAKGMLKSASFSLSGSTPTPNGRIPAPLLEAATATSQYHAAPLGVTLASLFGEYVREDVAFSFEGSFAPGTGYEEQRCEDVLEERVAAYRAAIQPILEGSRAVLLVVPTTAEVAYWSEALNDLSPAVISGTLAPKYRAAAFKAAGAPGILVICTPTFSWIPLPHLGLVILERVSAGGYRLMQRPYLDMRRTLADLARARSLPIWYGDFPLPIEYRAVPGAPLATAPETNAHLIDARITEAQKLEGISWSAVAADVRAPIREALDAGGRVLVLAVRKGYAPTVVCRDCGQALADERGVLFTFSAHGGKRFLRTADGVTERSADLLCPHCESWNLVPLGIGVERVAEELRERFPDAAVLEVTAEVRTQTGARKILADAAAPRTIVVGTESVLPWLLALRLPRFTLGVLASADSLLSVPFWRARERLVRLGLLLGQCAETLYVVSRLPEDAAVQTLVAPDTGTFFAEEAALRKALHYPPFGTLIALQLEAPRARIDDLAAEVGERLGTQTFSTLPDRILSATRVRRSLVLHLPQDAWPDRALSATLAQLPPSVRVLVDPEAF